MKVITKTVELKAHLSEVNGSVGFVPTMGALHKGHLSLLEESVKENSFTVLSIFVNPTQFLDGEDLDKYPRTFEADSKIAQLCGVDVIFYPDVKEIYSADEISVKAPNIRGSILEGYERPGHFDGVLSVVLKLFNIVKPNSAYFGKKDAQQLFLIKQLVDNIYLDINIVEMTTYRDEDGLALSSRNRYLSETQRQEALKLPNALHRASSLILEKEFTCSTIKQSILRDLKPLHVDYVEIVNREFEYISEIELGNTLILVALHVGSTRLIDNLYI